MKRILTTVALATLLFAAIPFDAHAVPSLGVGTDSGYVNATDAYQTYWGSNIPGAPGADGFAIGASGSKLHVWSNIMSADIYLLTTSDVALGNTIAFNGMLNQYLNTGNFASYSPTPYYGINLGQVNGSWTSLSSPPFSPGQFNYKDVTVTYTGDIGANQWIFAAADTNGVAGLQAKSGSFWTDDNGLDGIQKTETTVWVDTNSINGIQKKDGKIKIVGNWVTYLADSESVYEADTFTKYGADKFSPKTTAANGTDVPAPVPEPGTMMLLGLGFFGLAIYGKRRKN
jgi:hypothetical protein